MAGLCILTSATGRVCAISVIADGSLTDNFAINVSVLSDIVTCSPARLDLRCRIFTNVTGAIGEQLLAGAHRNLSELELDLPSAAVADAVHRFARHDCFGTEDLEFRRVYWSRFAVEVKRSVKRDLQE